MPHIGKFEISEDLIGDDYPIVRAAQEGCAVIRCEYMAYKRAFEIVAAHPDFAPVPRGGGIPEYNVEMVRTPVGIRRLCFRPKGASTPVAPSTKDIRF